MVKVETHAYPPEIHEKFSSWEEATKFLRETVDRCVDDGYWFRAVELRHERDYDKDKDVIMVYIRRFPKIVAETKADKIVLESLASFRERV